jgi:hypothetical protein
LDLAIQAPLRRKTALCKPKATRFAKFCPLNRWIVKSSGSG